MTKTNAIIASVAAIALLAGCGEQQAKVEPANLDGVSAFTETCQAESKRGSNQNENALFQPLSRAPLKPLDPLLGNVRARKTQSLNGQWRYIVDQLDIGDASPLLRGGVGENESYGASELLEYAFTDKYSLQVPGDWNSQSESLFWYRGVIWYQRDFNYQVTAGKRVHLYFGGANFAKDIYLNGKLIARHKGGFTPFNSDVTDYIQEGENSVVVKVNSMSGPAEVPTEYNDWMNYGGITRDVMLVETESVFIQNYKLQLKPSSDNTISGWLQLGGENLGNITPQLTLDIPEANIQKSFKSDDNGRIEFEFVADLELWSPESPKLYKVNWRLVSQTLSDNIGFRSIETRGEDILLNGKSIFLRGISTHEESLLRHGRANSQEDADALVQKLSALNANFVRLAHYPHNEYVARAADKAGFLVWAEMPVYHSIQFNNPCTLASAKQQYSELISRDQNRASIILWSLGNETPEGEDRNRFFVSMAEHVRSLDDTRLLTAALLGFGGMEAIGKYLGTLLAAEQNPLIDLVTNPEPVAITINDPLGDIVDVLGYNEYLGWYLSGILTQKMNENGLEVNEAQVRELMLREMEKTSIITAFNKPLVISEFGAGAKYGKRGGPLDVWSEDYQARVYTQQLKMLENSPALRGISPWILKDFRAPYRINTDIQNYWNRKGLLSESGEEKLAFKVLSDYYSQKAQAQ